MDIHGYMIMTNIATENGPCIVDLPLVHCKWRFSIAMLVYQRVEITMEIAKKS